MSGIHGAAGATGVHQIIALRQQIIERSQLLQQVRTPQPEVPAGAPSIFADALKSALDGVSETQAKAERLTDGYQRGEVTDIARVMLARQEAGVAFEATLQVRNRLLSAYQEIMRMGV